MRKPIVLLVVLPPLFLAACSSSSSVAPASTTTSSTVATTSTTAADPAADKVIVQKLLLVSSDLPAGWTSAAQDPITPDEQAIVDETDGCSGVAPDSQTRVVDVEGPEFTKDDMAIDVSADSLKSEELVKKENEAYTNPANFPCSTSAINSETQKELDADPTTAGDKVSSMVQVLTNVAGPNEHAIRFTTVIDTGSTTITSYQDTLIADYGRFEAEASVSVTDAAPPTADFDKHLLAAEEAHIKAVSQAA